MISDEDYKRLNLPTQNFPPKLDISIGGVLGGHDQRPRERRRKRRKKDLIDRSNIMHQEDYMSYKIKSLMKEINEAEGNPLQIAKEKAEYIHDAATLGSDLDALLFKMAEIAETRSGDAINPESKKKWAESAKLLKDLIPKLPIVHY